MEITDLLRDLKEAKIVISLEGENLKVSFQGSTMPQDLLHALKEHKQSVIEHLKKARRTTGTKIEKVTDAVDYPLSSSQKRLWVLSQFEGATEAYNMPLALRLKGEVDLPKMNQALAAVIERHESLRTAFILNEETEVRQKVLKSVDYTVSTYDLTGETDSLTEYIEKECRFQFDLTSGRLFHVNIYQLKNDESVLMINMHHIISDGWSFNVLTRDLFTVYNGLMSGATPALLPLPIQYKDYAVFEQTQTASGEDAQYWKEKLKGTLPVLNFPTTYSRKAVKGYKGGMVTRTLSREVFQSVKTLASEKKYTTFTTLTALLNAFLYKYTGQTDMILGTPIAGRNYPELKEQVGFFVNTLLLRTTFSTEISFSELLDNVHATHREAFKHQAYPFDRIVEDLKLKKDTSRSPVFDIMVRLDAATNQESLQITGVKAEAIDLPMNSTKFDLIFNFYEKGTELSLNLEYDADLFSHAFVERICENFEFFCNELIKFPETSIAKIHYLPKEKEGLLLQEFTGKSLDLPQDTMVEWFEKQVSRVPESIALSFQEQTYTYKELNEEVNRLSLYIREKGVRPTNVVAIELTKSDRLIIAILATLKAGGVYLCLDLSYPTERLDFMKKDSGAVYLIDVKVWEEFSSIREQLDFENDAVQTADQDPFYMIYTSGTTGLPKGVLMHQGGVKNIIYDEMMNYKLVGKTVLQFSNNNFDVSSQEIFGTLCKGSHLVVPEEKHKKDLKAFAELIEKQLVDTLYLPTSFFKLMQSEELVMRKAFRSVQNIAVAGEQLVVYDLCYQLMEEYQVRLYNHYGPTETHVVTTLEASRLLPDRWWVNPPIGHSVCNTTALVLDKNNRLCDKGLVGELCISGASVAIGYKDRPEIETEKFVSNPFDTSKRMYRTGDLAKYAEDGIIEYIGRADNQVKIRGYRVEIAEVEALLLSHQEIEQVAVLVEKDEQENAFLSAYMVAENALQTSNLRNHMTKHAPEYLVPSRFVQLNEIPRTPNGKVDQKAIMELGGATLATGTEYKAPEGKEEEQLVQLWSQVLEIPVDTIGVEDNFYDLGGNSIKLIKLAKLINETFGLNMNVVELFNYPNIALFAKYLQTENFVGKLEKEREEEMEGQVTETLDLINNLTVWQEEMD